MSYKPELDHFDKNGMGLHQTPVLAIRWRRPDPDNEKYEFRTRGIGFICENLGGGLYLVAACKHALRSSRWKEQCSVFNVFGSELAIAAPPIKDPRKESDVVFLIMRYTSLLKPVRCFSLNKKRRKEKIHKDLYFYNSRDQDDCPLDMMKLSQAQEIEQYQFFAGGPAPERGFQKIHVCKKGELSIEAIQSKRWTKLIAFENSEKAPGTSGSPVFNEDLELVGMHMGSMDFMRKSLSIYIPVKQLIKAKEILQKSIDSAVAKIRQKRPSL